MQPNSVSMECRRPLRILLTVLPALALAGLNAVKPVHIDDAIYLRYAQQILQHPFDPYGFEMFWFQWPENANWVLCPIGVPYWIALGMAILGQTIWALKLWMTPFAIGLIFSADALLRRSGVAKRGTILWMIAFSPVVLPGFNLMLDVPVMALSLISLVLTLRSMERPSTGTAITAGIICGLAILTKWTAFLFPPMFLFVAWRHRDWLRGLIVCGVSAIVVVAWEGYVAHQYGQSHLVFQITVGDENRQGAIADVIKGFFPLLGATAGMALPLLAAGWGRVAWLTFPLVLAAWIVSPLIPFPSLPFAVLGVVVLAAILIAVYQLFRNKPPLLESLLPQLLTVWLILEMAGYFVLSPFPAMRRMMGVQIAVILLSAVFVQNGGPFRGRWIGATCVLTMLLGLAVNAIDYLDARALRSAAAQGVKWARKTYPQATVYYAGHWSFQYYAELAGAAALVPDQTRLKAGDVVVLNNVTAGPALLLPQDHPDHTLLATDAIPFSALAFHQYFVPLLWQNSPRVQVGVFLIKSDQRIYSNRSPEELVSDLAKRSNYLSSGAIDALIAGLQFGKPATQKLAAKLINESGPKALVQALEHEDPAVRMWALKQSPDAPEVRRVVEKLASEDPDPRVREAARHLSVAQPRDGRSFPATDRY